MRQLSHVDDGGRPTMVDVGGKPISKRMAEASGFIKLNKEVLELVCENRVKKGNVLATSEIAGIMAGKKTADLIPLCHNLNITNIALKAEVLEGGIKVAAEVACDERTGVEMEALTAVSVALLTIYDMCKAVDKNMEIGEIKLVSKTKKEMR